MYLFYLSLSLALAFSLKPPSHPHSLIHLAFTIRIWICWSLAHSHGVCPECKLFIQYNLHLRGLEFLGRQVLSAYFLDLSKHCLFAHILCSPTHGLSLFTCTPLGSYFTSLTSFSLNIPSHYYCFSLVGSRVVSTK